MPLEDDESPQLIVAEKSAAVASGLASVNVATGTWLSGWLSVAKIGNERPAVSLASATVAVVVATAEPPVLSVSRRVIDGRRRRSRWRRCAFP